MRRQPEHASPDRAIPRRTALAVVLGGVAWLLGSAVALTGGFLGNALRQKTARKWIRIGPAERLSPETFQRHVVRIEHRHAWRRERVPLTIYIRDLYPADPIALLSTCTHLGCSVAWDRDLREFRCPCHGGRYDEQGRVVSGPPPRPLTRLEVKIEDEVCYVRLPSSGGQGGVG